MASGSSGSLREDSRRTVFGGLKTRFPSVPWADLTRKAIETDQRQMPRSHAEKYELKTIWYWYPLYCLGGISFVAFIILTITGIILGFFYVPNGAYAYTVGGVTGYTSTPSSGTVTVAGAAVSVPIVFTALPPGQYTVTFTEAGLPSGTSWSVTLNGTTLSSTTTAIVFTEANGTYPYTVGSVTGYTATPASGSIGVSGRAQSVPITFTSIPPAEYAVTFTETGLPSGTSWSVTLAGSTKSSGTSTIVFSEPNGTYAYTLGSVTGFTASVTSGSVTVNGAPQGITVAFTAVSPTPLGPAAPVDYSWLIVLAILIAAAAVGAVLAVRRRSRKKWEL